MKSKTSAQKNSAQGKVYRFKSKGTWGKDLKHIVKIPPEQLNLKAPIMGTDY
jgi:hypothetical protein